MKNFVDEILKEIAEEENKSVAKIKNELSDYVNKKSKTLKQLIEDFEKRSKTLKQLSDELPELDKLAMVEDLILKNKLTLYSATALIMSSPLSEREVNKIVCQIKQYFKQEYNLAFPDYQLIYEKTSYIDDIAGSTNFEKKTITIPNNLGLITPVTLAHELAHAYQAENSRLYDIIKRAVAENNIKELNNTLHNSYYLTEGWATFVSKLYARKLDAKFNNKVYETLLEEKNNFTNFMFVFTQQKVYHAYSYGCSLFESIHEKYGFDKALICATQLTNDFDLEYAA